MHMYDATLPAVAVIACLVAMAAKALKLRSELLPLICGLTGAVIGLIGYFLVPDFTTATNVITAVAEGIVSGLAATGANQVLKQFNKAKHSGETVQHSPNTTIESIQQDESRS